jgi:hypothetical protein
VLLAYAKNTEGGPESQGKMEKKSEKGKTTEENRDTRLKTPGI